MGYIGKIGKWHFYRENDDPNLQIWGTLSSDKTKSLIPSATALFVEQFDTLIVNHLQPKREGCEAKFGVNSDEAISSSSSSPSPWEPSQFSICMTGAWIVSGSDDM